MPADEVDVVGHALGRGPLLERVPQRPVADDRELDAPAGAAQLADGGDEIGGALALDQLAHGEHERLAGEVVGRRLDLRPRDRWCR